MAVTKRTRFEILRRDEHTCQYCGAKAPDVTLHIDHVVPVSLGGDDKPSNLVTACKDCNTGKASISPDSPLVQGLSDRAAAYALGMVDKMTRFRADLESLEEYVESFRATWDDWGVGDGPRRVTFPLPDDFEMSLFKWKQMGIPTSVYDLAIPPAMLKPGLARDARFSYMAGIVWNMVNSREIDYSVTDETAAVMTQNEVDGERVEAYQRGFDIGWGRGHFRAGVEHLSQDYLQHHIDQTEMVLQESLYDHEKTYMSGGVRKRGEGVRAA